MMRSTGVERTEIRDWRGSEITRNVGDDEPHAPFSPFPFFLSFPTFYSFVMKEALQRRELLVNLNIQGFKDNFQESNLRRASSET